MNDHPKVPVNLDLDALRAFVKGIELGSYHLAAQQLCRSPAAISAQLKKLEQQTGCQLLRKQGRLLELTPNGEVLFSHAKNILAMNDTVLLQLNQNQASGVIRFGLQEDFAEGTLQRLIAQFKLRHPNIQFQIQVDRNRFLFDKVQKQELDLALLWQTAEQLQNFYPIQSVQSQWMVGTDRQISHLLQLSPSVPLVLLQQPCKLRQMAIEKLEEAGLPWHIAYECNSVQALWPALRAGIGISPRSVFYMPADICMLSEPMLPQLTPLTFGLYLADVKTPPIISQFKTYIEQHLH